jgi:hypothetical protein
MYNVLRDLEITDLLITHRKIKLDWGIEYGAPNLIYHFDKKEHFYQWQYQIEI